jgi:hypothetical protein
MIFLGNSILGNLNKEATSQKSLGVPFWRLVIASGIIVFVMGFVNLFTVSPSYGCSYCGMLTSMVELHLRQPQTTTHSPTSSLAWRSSITKSRRRSLHPQTPNSKEPLSIFLPRRQARHSSFLHLIQERSNDGNAQNAFRDLQSVPTESVTNSAESWWS